MIAWYNIGIMGERLGGYEPSDEDSGSNVDKSALDIYLESRDSIYKQLDNKDLTQKQAGEALGTARRILDESSKLEKMVENAPATSKDEWDELGDDNIRMLQLAKEKREIENMLDKGEKNKLAQKEQTRNLGEAGRRLAENRKITKREVIDEEQKIPDPKDDWVQVGAGQGNGSRIVSREEYNAMMAAKEIEAAEKAKRKAEREVGKTNKLTRPASKAQRQKQKHQGGNKSGNHSRNTSGTREAWKENVEKFVLMLKRLGQGALVAALTTVVIASIVMNSKQEDVSAANLPDVPSDEARGEMPSQEAYEETVEEAEASPVEVVKEEAGDVIASAETAHEDKFEMVGENNKERIWNYLRSEYNLSNEMIAMIMGNINKETVLFDPMAKQNNVTYAIPKNGDGLTGFGLAQWTFPSRQKELFKKIDEAGLGKYYGAGYGSPEANKNIPQEDIDLMMKIQLDHIMVGEYGPNYLKPMENMSIADGVTYFHDKVENSADANMNARINFANEIYAELNGR